MQSEALSTLQWIPGWLLTLFAICYVSIDYGVVYVILLNSTFGYMCFSGIWHGLDPQLHGYLSRYEIAIQNKSAACLSGVHSKGSFGNTGNYSSFQFTFPQMTMSS